MSQGGGFALDGVDVAIGSVAIKGALALDAANFAAGQFSIHARDLDDVSPLALQKLSGDIDADIALSHGEGGQDASLKAKAYKGRAVVPVTITVNTGPQFSNIAVVDLANREPFSADVLPPRIVKLRPGDPAKAADLRAANARLIDHFRMEGRSSAARACSSRTQIPCDDRSQTRREDRRRDHFGHAGDLRPHRTRAAQVHYFRQ